MAFFSNPSNVMVNDSNMYDIRGNQINNYAGNPPPDLHHILSPVGDASYTRPGPVARCHPGTRLEVIAEIEKWIKYSHNCPILWLNGPAGSGKSAISQTIAERCVTNGKIIASFFFFRSAGRRSTIRYLIPTLAHQISTLNIDAKHFLIDTMSNEPNLHHEKSLRHQLDKLLINPIWTTGLDLSKVIIIIDALDECDDKQLISEFIEAIVDICNTPNFQLPFRLFLTSRVEEHIQEQFYKSTTQSVIKYLSLQNFDATKDIQLYLESRLFLLYRSKPRLMHGISWPWPSKEDLEMLSTNAAGSFIIASTLVTFIEKAKGHPDNNLKEALDMTDGLDPVYHQVITTALQENKTLRDKHLHILYRVLAVIGLAEEPLSVTDMSVLLEREAHHIVYMLLGLQAILLIPEKDNEPVKVFHTSLRDYLCLKERSKDLCINMQQSHAMLAIRCLELAAEYSKKDYKSKNQEIAIYGGKYWLHHLNESLKNAKNQDFLNDVMLNSALAGFTSQQVIFWCMNTKGNTNMEILKEMLKLKEMPMKMNDMFEDLHTLLKADRRRLSVIYQPQYINH